MHTLITVRDHRRERRRGRDVHAKLRARHVLGRGAAVDGAVDRKRVVYQ